MPQRPIRGTADPGLQTLWMKLSEALAPLREPIAELPRAEESPYPMEGVQSTRQAMDVLGRQGLNAGLAGVEAFLNPADVMGTVGALAGGPVGWGVAAASAFPYLAEGIAGMQTKPNVGSALEALLAGSGMAAGSVPAARQVWRSRDAIADAIMRPSSTIASAAERMGMTPTQNRRSFFRELSGKSAADRRLSAEDYETAARADFLPRRLMQLSEDQLDQLLGPIPPSLKDQDPFLVRRNQFDVIRSNVAHRPKPDEMPSGTNPPRSLWVSRGGRPTFSDDSLDETSVVADMMAPAHLTPDEVIDASRQGVDLSGHPNVLTLEQIRSVPEKDRVLLWGSGKPLINSDGLPYRTWTDPASLKRVADAYGDGTVMLYSPDGGGYPTSTQQDITNFLRSKGIQADSNTPYPTEIIPGWGKDYVVLKPEETGAAREALQAEVDRLGDVLDDLYAESAKSPANRRRVAEPARQLEKLRANLTAALRGEIGPSPAYTTEGAMKAAREVQDLGSRSVLDAASRRRLGATTGNSVMDNTIDAMSNRVRSTLRERLRQAAAEKARKRAAQAGFGRSFEAAGRAVAAAKNIPAGAREAVSKATVETVLGPPPTVENLVHELRSRFRMATKKKKRGG